MKLLLPILIVLILSMGVVMKLLVDKTEQFDTMMQALKRTNTKLKKSNRKLVAKQQKIQKKVKAQRKRFAKKFLTRTEAKLASAPAKAVPLLGISVIIGMSAYEIHGYCEDIKEMRTLEESLFGASDDKSDQNEEKICGMDVEITLKPILAKQYEASRDWIENASKRLGEKIKACF